jgi:formiminotetrahydrofolate cyclodeaminase
MVAGLPRTRTGTEEDRQALASASAVLGDIRLQLTEAIDADTAAYDQVVRSYKLPKGNDGEREIRAAAIQEGLRAATEVPRRVVRLSASALALSERVAAHGHRAAASDVGVAVALLRAGLRGAKLNVAINLGSLADAAYATGVRSEIEGLSIEADRAATAADTLLGVV